jgi:hypothetical protein
MKDRFLSAKKTPVNATSSLETAETTPMKPEIDDSPSAEAAKTVEAPAAAAVKSHAL